MKCEWVEEWVNIELNNLGKFDKIDSKNLVRLMLVFFRINSVILILSCVNSGKINFDFFRKDIG